MSASPMLDQINSQTRNNNSTQVNPQLQVYKNLLKQLQTANNPQAMLQQMLSQSPGLKQALDIARLSNGNIVQAAQFVANQTGNNLSKVLETLQN